MEIYRTRLAWGGWIVLISYIIMFSIVLSLGLDHPNVNIVLTAISALLFLFIVYLFAFSGAKVFTFYDDYFTIKAPYISFYFKEIKFYYTDIKFVRFHDFWRSPDQLIIKYKVTGRFVSSYSRDFLTDEKEKIAEILSGKGVDVYFSEFFKAQKYGEKEWKKIPIELKER